MCTLSFYRQGAGGYHIYMNRDERHDREKAEFPQILSAENKVYGPLDPPSGGTWIAYNENGYWGCLLNGYFDDEDMPPPQKSRGLILTELLANKNPIASSATLNVEDYASFRLVIGSATDHSLWVWNRHEYLQSEFHSKVDDRAFFLTSSSWNQTEVIKQRTILFDEYMKAGEAGDALPSFHRSNNPSLEAAPMMHRSYSATQSITQLHIYGKQSEMQYEAIS